MCSADVLVSDKGFGKLGRTYFFVWGRNNSILVYFGPIRG